MMDKELLPYIPEPVILYMEKTFPNELPKEEISAFNLGRKVGIQDAIQHLKVVKQWSEEKDVQD